MMARDGVRYSIWKDVANGCYEVVRWDNGDHAVVQTNIMTRDKARKALSIWKQREKAREQGASEC